MTLLTIRAFLSKAWPFILAAAVALLLVLVYRAGAGAARSEMAAELAAANERAARVESAAKERAAEERARDTASIEATRKDQVNAIENADPGDVRRAAACARVRAAHGDQAALSAGCGPAR